MKFISKYNNFLNESTDNNNDVVDKIVDNMLDLIDSGYEVRFQSGNGTYMYYSDYLAKNSNYEKFKPVLVSKNKTVSKFSILISSEDIINYDNVLVILDDTQSAIGRLGEDGWVLSEFNVKSEDYKNGDKVNISYVSFDFTKPDVKSEGSVELPNKDKLVDELEKLGFQVEDITIRDSETELEFSAYDDAYDAMLPSEESCEDKFQRICDIFGFDSFDLNYRRSKVTFEY